MSKMSVRGFDKTGIAVSMGWSRFRNALQQK